MLLTQILNSILIGSLFFDMLERRYPTEFKNALIQTSMNLIFIYSKLQIHLIKINKKIYDFIESNSTLLKIKNEFDAIMNLKNTGVSMTEFFKDGKVAGGDLEFDFAVNSWFDNDKKCFNKQIIHNINKLNTMTECSECSDIKFILVEVAVGENIYKVDLKTDTFNYYIVGNEFNRLFFIYYLKHHRRYQNINFDNKMSLKIIDNNINELKVDFTDKNEYILLEKNGYKLEITSSYSDIK